jgi:hypothetical protein
MNTDNTQGVNEPSPASAGSHGDASRAAFERWADGDGCLRTIKKKNGSYLDGPTRWAWEGWRTAALTDEERVAIALAKSRLGTSDGDWQADDVLAALLERLG